MLAVTAILRAICRKKPTEKHVLSASSTFCSAYPAHIFVYSTCWQTELTKHGCILKGAKEVAVL